MPPIYDKNDARKFIALRHPEYDQSVIQAQWLLDTLSADSSYRDARYGTDHYGKPVRNLWRLPHELPLRDASGAVVRQGNPFNSLVDQPELFDASEEMYQVRRGRTPVPQYMPMYIEKIMGKIYKRKIERTGPPAVIAWTENVDARRTSLDEFMRDTVAPILCALGMIDVAFDHPTASPNTPDYFGGPSDATGCVCRIILPEHMLWWIKDASGFFYIECLVREYIYDSVNNKYVYQFRHWTWQDWTLYGPDGDVLGTGTHTYQIAPIIRLFDKKSIRSDDVARSRFWGIADKSRAYYNEESELILNDTYHNCPLLQGPPDDGAAGTDDGVPIGRNLILRMVLDRDGHAIGYSYISPPSEPSQFMMTRLAGLVSAMETEAGLTRTVGAVGGGGEVGPVQQSGISKAYDQSEGSDYLAGISHMLGTNDYAVLLLALVVLTDGGATFAEIKEITSNYPSRFNLLTFDEIALISTAIQTYQIGPVGQIPEGDKQTLKLMYRELHPDLDGDTMRDIEDEIDEYVDAKAKEWKNRPQPGQVIIPGTAPSNGFGGPAGNGDPLKITAEVPAQTGPAANQQQSKS